MAHRPRSRQSTTRTLGFLAAAGLVAFALDATAGVRTVSVPVELDAAYVRHAFVTQAYTDEGASARVWDDGVGCNFMVLTDPQVDAADGLVRIRTATDARVGQSVAGRCLVVLDWVGTVETAQEVELEPGGTAILFRVVDSTLHEGEVSRGAFASVLWDWLKGYVHPRLGAVRIDLQPALNDLRAVLPLVLAGEHENLQRMIDTVRLGGLEVIDGALRVQLDFEVPVDDDAPPPAPEPALSEEEIARFEAAWRGWDGFITFVVRHFAATSAVAEVRRELLAVLIDARYDIIDILADDSARQGQPDPVQRLFMQTWERLSPVLRRMSPDLPGEQGLNLLSFMAAADVVRALDALGPGVDVDISADGLRRMARILAPEPIEDPLLYDQQVDPELRRLFDFGPPLVPPRDNPSFDPQGRWPTIDWMPRAWAATGPDEALIARLNGWIPEREELGDYLPMVRDLLSDTALSVAADSKLDPAHYEMYRRMTLATAWQETCWRQFRRDGDRIVPMSSGAGAVGIMQIMPNVWRGFYDPAGLARDIGYNAAAGSEILMHYLVDYAIARGEHEQAGGVDNLPRAAYAAYNGGPRHLRRYRESGTAESLQRLDRAFWDKYRAVADGDELAVLACYTS